MEKIDAVIEYCTTRLADVDKLMTSDDYKRGRQYALERILDIAKTGQIWYECSEEDKRKESIRFLTKKIAKCKEIIQSHAKDTKKLQREIEEKTKQLQELEKLDEV